MLFSKIVYDFSDSGFSPGESLLGDKAIINTFCRVSLLGEPLLFIFSETRTAEFTSLVGDNCWIPVVLFLIPRDSSSITIHFDCLLGYAKCFGYGSDWHSAIVMGTDKIIHVHSYFHTFRLLHKILSIKILQDVFPVVNLFSSEMDYQFLDYRIQALQEHPERIRTYGHEPIHLHIKCRFYIGILTVRKCADKKVYCNHTSVYTM